MDKCIECKGFKTVTPLGGITKQCPICKGIGYIVSVEPAITLLSPTPPTKRKAGRPRVTNV